MALLCFRGLVECLNRLIRQYKNKSSSPRLPHFGNREQQSSGGHYGSWNALRKQVNIWKCRKSVTRPCVDILIKAKSCFGPLSSVKNFILGAKYHWKDIRGPGKSNIMFCNSATANSTCCTTRSSQHRFRRDEWDFMTDSAALHLNSIVFNLFQAIHNYHRLISN